MDNPFELIFQELKNINKALQELKGSQLHIVKPIAQRKMLNIDEAATVVNLSKSRLYVLAGEGTVPNFKIGNKLRFYEDELISWLESGRRHTSVEIDLMADESLKNA